MSSIINYDGANELFYSWTVTTENSTNVSFSDSNLAATNATFATTGVYGIRLSVSDGTLTDFDEIEVIVTHVGASGLSSRPGNTACIAPDNAPPTGGSVELSHAFPNLPALGSGETPIAMKQPPNDATIWFLVTQQGSVFTFANDPNTSTLTEALKIPNTRLDYVGNSELGLLGIAIHPDFANNNYIYLSFTSEAAGRQSTISRWNYNPATGLIDPNSEYTILEVAQPVDNHNGGNIAFSPSDGYLYIGFGDGGASGDQYLNGQDTTSLLGAVLRIDVDNSSNGARYAIPPDNPFSGPPSCRGTNGSCPDDPKLSDASPPGQCRDLQDNTINCPEIFAYGLRNPWRWSFDRSNGDLWLGDVGQGSFEEINFIESGGNYGWNHMEGPRCFISGPNTTPCTPPVGMSLPVYSYGRSDGRSVVGGYVYRGNDLAWLQGVYIFTDYYSGYSLRALTLNTNGQYDYSELIPNKGGFTPSFAEDNTGELYLLQTGAAGTNVLKLVSASGAATPSIPTHLSETGCVNPANPLEPATGLIPFEPIAPLWSDGAEKHRYFAIPDGTTISIDPVDGDFVFPSGTVLVKNFYLNKRIFETRLLMLHQTGWGGYSYEWQYDTSGNPTDAVLLANAKDKLFEGVNWHYPSRAECFQCHTEAANFSIGPEASQLNHTTAFRSTFITANQLETYNSIGLFTNPIDSTVQSMHFFSLNDSGATLEQRSRSYLHTNCSTCHRPNGGGRGPMDLRFQTPFNLTYTCGHAPSFGDLSIQNPEIIKRGVPGESVLLVRMNSTDGNRMPKLGTGLVDTEATTLLSEWISSISVCP
ncbi:MAG: PQQ-dependent sugar dehydrogenase [Gammaproteobacteria bacterium]|nr:PQQ-dependent sugar dehydrogenase [Gammaproteobacteria bacterium]MDH5803166.1 PQQ-dependent sugar dehydrogenase [Gammaproteobacteria bacterium]